MAYNTATILEGDLFFVAQTGSYQIYVTYTGNAGEQPVRVSYNVNTTDVAGYGTVLRGQAMRMLDTLNANAQIAAGITLPKVLDTTAPIPPPAATVFGSYLVASDAFTPGSAPTDVWTISGSATTTVVLKQLWLSTRQTTAGVNGWQVVARSAANSGGTSATISPVKMNVSYPAATAVVRQYTANPSALGNLVGSLWSGWVASPAPASAVGGPLVIPLWPEGAFPGLPLNGTGQSFALNFGGVALPAGLSVRVIALFEERG